MEVHFPGQRVLHEYAIKSQILIVKEGKSHLDEGLVKELHYQLLPEIPGKKI